MRGRRTLRGAWRVWGVLLRSQLREQPTRLILSVLAIALGVCLAAAIFLVNQAALAQFTDAGRRLVGSANVIVRGPRAGFAEALFGALARDPRVAIASPVLEIEAAVPGRREPLAILGIDPFRAGRLQSALVDGIGPRLPALFRTNAILLSAVAAARLGLHAGDALHVVVGDQPERLRVIGILPARAYSQPLGLMDIASAQWIFARIGRLNRIDLRLADGVDAAAFRAELSRRLPVGVLALAPHTQIDRTAAATRAYRVNLNMLALVALWTGAFLVFSTQSLSVLRRRASLALLRALGVTRAELQLALAAEGAALGAAGALLGVAGAVALADAMLRTFAGGLGDGRLQAVGAALPAQPAAIVGFFSIGVLVAAIGAWLPARSAARRPPAAALKGGNLGVESTAPSTWLLGAGFLALGGALARLPPIAHLALFGYLSIAALLLGAVLTVPAATVALLRVAPHTGRPVFDTAIAQLRDNVRPSTLSLASIIVSYSLMVAMMIMVHSFRSSFENWLVKLLPADIEMRVPPGNDTAFWSAGEQARISAVPGIAKIRFRRTLRIALDRRHPPITLIARDIDAADARQVLPIVAEAALARAARLQPVWISEGLADLYGYRAGQTIRLPLGGRLLGYAIAGVWRDYARSDGSIVLPRPAYEAATGDHDATQASLWLSPGFGAASVAAAVRARLAAGDAVQIMTSTAVRRRSLRVFDRAFAITYALEAIAVAIGLVGVAFAIGSTALARRAEFGMLRHIGLRRRDVVALLTEEGVVLTSIGVVYGLLLGVLLSLVLVFVVNRQSFHWSIDLAIPVLRLLELGLILVAAAAGTAILSGHAAGGEDAVRAVREDW
ncbi:MAG TPA: ABC transporter permease [Steroidobacteraceae bacterium]|nr:ABC transporter permease [Steroidobacteraceae bacterium]